MTVVVPEPPESGAEPQRELGLPVLDGPGEHTAQVVVLTLQAGQPRRLSRTPLGPRALSRQLAPCVIRHLRIPLGQRSLRALHFPSIDEVLVRILSHGLEQAVTNSLSIRLREDERLLDEPREVIQHM